MSLPSSAAKNHEFEQHQQGLTRSEILKHLESCERVLESKEVDLSDGLLDIPKWPKLMMNHRPTSETALHIAVRCDLERVVRLLVEWLRGAPDHYYQDFVNKKDCSGATVLHLATSRKQLQTLRLLLEESSDYNGMMDINAQNDGGFTALDILQVLPEGGEIDKEIEKVLRRAGALRGRHIIKQQSEQSNHEVSAENSKEHLPLSVRRHISWFKFPFLLTAAYGILLYWMTIFSSVLVFQTVQDMEPSLIKQYCLGIPSLLIRSNLAAFLSGVVVTLLFTYMRFEDSHDC